VYCWASTLFIAGFILRAYGSWHYDHLPIFIASIVLLYAAPPIYELGNYIILGRCLHYIPHLSPIHPDRTITLFLLLSTVIEALTANGAARSFTDNESARHTGKILLKLTLLLQLGVVALLIILTAIYHIRARRSGLLKYATSNVENVLITLYISCTLITIRTIFRTVEYFAVASLRPPYESVDNISPLIRYEWLFYFFEVMVMFLNSVLLNARHPGKYLPVRNDAFLTAEGVEKKGVDFSKDRRPTWRKICDPLDLYTLVFGTDEKWWLKEGETEEAAEPIRTETEQVRNETKA
jgi:hypothetical protein